MTQADSADGGPGGHRDGYSEGRNDGRGDGHYDVAIVGAGPVGLALACELALARCSVVVLERLTAIDPTIKAGSLGPLAGEALARRGLEPAMAKVEAVMLQQMQAAMQAAAGPGAGPGAGNATGPGAGPGAGNAAGPGTGPGAGNAAGPSASNSGASPTGAPAMLTNARGKPIGGHFAGLFLIDQSVQAEPWRRNRGVAQQALEDMLGRRAAELGVTLRRGHSLHGFTQSADEVAIAARGPAGDVALTARYLVGCDGGRSFVRKHAGFEFPGTPPAITGYQALVELADPRALLPLGWRRTPTGMLAYGPVPGRILLVEFDGPPGERDAPVERDELQAALRRVSGVDATITAIRTATRWTDNARQATSYRLGRVLLAGDAAHVHSPFGGQGLNLGIGDAVNLGWKLAATLHGRAPDGLLDSYTAERHPVAARVLANTRAQVALMQPGPHVDALRELVTDLLGIDEVNRYFGAMLGGLDLRYPAAGDHPLAGRPCADLALTLPDDTPAQSSGSEQLSIPAPCRSDSPDEERRSRLSGTRLILNLYALMRDGRALLVVLDGDDEVARHAAGLDDQIQVIRARAGQPELAATLGAALIRPDGFVAWAAAPGAADHAGLDRALHTWFVRRDSDTLAR